MIVFTPLSMVVAITAMHFAFGSPQNRYPFSMENLQSTSPMDGFKPMGTDNIKAFVSGHTLASDPSMDATHVPFWEHFDVSGGWSISFRSRTVITRTGRWLAKDGKLCVSLSVDREHCRSVYYAKDKYKAFLSFPERGNESVVLMKYIK